MKRWIVLALAALLAAAGMYAAIARKPAEKPGGEGEALWLPVTAESVREIEVRSQEGAYALVREGSAWSVIPRASGAGAAKADPVKVKALLDFLSLNKPVGSLPPQGDAATGLDAPRLRLSLRSEPGKGQAQAVNVEIAVGRATPGGEAVYAANSLTPGTVFLLAPGWARQVEHPADYYFDSRVFGLTESEVTRVRSGGPSGVNWEVARKDGGFVFQLPETAKDKPVAESDMKLFIHNLVGLKAELLPQGAVATGEPFLRIEVGGPAGRTEVLEVFRDAAGPGMVLARSTGQSAPFGLERGAVDKVAKTGFDLEGRRILDLDIGKVQSLRVSAGGQDILALKAESGWTEQGTGTALRGIDMALWRLTDMQFEAEPSGTLPKSAEWAMSCEALDKSGSRLAVLEFYPDPSLRAGLCWVRVNGGAMYYPVSAQLLKDLQGLFPLKK